MTATESNDTETISTEDYVQALIGISLSSITLVSCRTAVNWDTATATEVTSVPVAISDTAEFERDGGAITIRHSYDVTAKKGRKRLFYLKAEFAVKLAATDEFTQGFFRRFRDTSLPLVTWPYLRQLVGSMTEQMGLPRLQLGLWKTPFS